MKEIVVIIRPEKVNITKKVLAQAGYPAFTCQRVKGRGKRPLQLNPDAGFSLMNKRIFTLMVPSEAVENLVNTLMNANCTGNHGDGKIFVLPLDKSYQVRNGEGEADAY